MSSGESVGGDRNRDYACLEDYPLGRVEGTGMESFALPPDGHSCLKKYLEGELVEVRQREKGLRGSWFPAVVIAVKQGKRVVEYDELLTEDGGRKLTEAIPVGRGVDGARASSRASLKSPPGRFRALIRPRPLSTPNASKLAWKTGLWVDCYHKDAWWEGILQEDICSSRKQKRVSVFFPEEEDSESMFLKDMRVGQDWDEELGRWIPRGYADVPIIRNEKRVRTMSLGRESRGLQKSSPRDMELALALKIKNNESSEQVAEHTSACRSTVKTFSDNPGLTQHTESRCRKGNKLPDSACGEGLPSSEKSGARNPAETTALGFGAPELEPSIAEEASNKEGGSVSGSVDRGVSSDDDIDIRELDDGAARKLLVRSGWNVTQNIRKTGKSQWYYRAPGGTLLGSLCSALRYWEKIKKGEDENPTLSDLKFATPITRERKMREDCVEIVTTENGKKTLPVGAGDGAVETPNLANGFTGPGPLSPRQGVCSDGLPESRIVEDADRSDTTISKRSASQLEEEFDQRRITGEQKRRKTTVSIPEQGKSPQGGEMGHTSGHGSLGDHLSAGNEIALLRRSIGRDESTNMTDVKIVSLTSKKRVSTAEEISHNLSAEGRSVMGEPRTKKSRAISSDLVIAPEGKSRKSLVTLQESLQNVHVDPKVRKKPFSPHRAIDLKQTKKSFTQDFKQVKKSAKKSKKSRAPARGGVRLEALLSAPSMQSDPSAEGDTLLKKRTLLSWLIDHGMVEENERVRYLNRKDNHCMLEGYVTRDGIRCDCCGTVVTLSVFEAHAGSKLHRPSANIFLDNGKSLSECQVEALARKTQNESDTHKASDDQESADKSDDTCGICGDGGELICCDHCPSTFHLSCMGMEAVPDGDWFCPNCRCAICGGSQFNGDKSSFNDLTVIFCDQCECEYHVKCLRSRGIELDSCPQEDWFCGESCGRIFRGLRGLVGVPRPMEGGFSWTLLRSRAEDDRKSGCISNTELNAEHDSKLSIALSVMQECFRPMIDPRTKIDIISHVLYNRRSEVSRLNYHGFYTMLLERGDELISVATIRVHGARLAEMPLIGTRFTYRRQGMCRRLMSALEEMLRSVGVERMVLPAVPELLDTWTGAFGFMNMQGADRLQLMDLNIMAFPGTSLLHKSLGKPDVSGTGIHLTEIPDQGMRLQSGQPRKVGATSTSQARCMQTVKKRGRPPKAKEASGGVTEVTFCAEYSPKLCADYCPGSKPGSPGEIAKLEGPMSRSPVEDDRKKFVCPAEARKKRGRLARPRKGNLFGSFLSGVADEKVPNAKSSEPVTVWIEQVTRFGEDTGGVMYRPASPTGSVSVESITSEHGALPLRTAPSQGFHVTKVKREAGTGDSFGEILTEGDELEAKKAATMKILKSVLGVDKSETSGLMHPEVEDTSNLPYERSSSEESQSSEEEEELDPSWSIRTTSRSKRESFSSQVKTPRWVMDSINEAAKTPARPVPVRERSGDSRGLERQFQSRIPALESATASSTKTYERRRTKLSPLSQKEPLSRVRQMELADSDPISRTLDFSLDDLDRVQYYELEPVSVPMRTFPSQLTYHDRTIMPPGTFIPVQTDVVNSSLRGELGLVHSWHAGTASSEDNISGGSCDQGDDDKSRGTGLTVRLKLSNLHLEKKKKKKKKRSKDLMNEVLDKVQECNILAEQVHKPSIHAAGSCSRSRDREVTSPERFDPGQSKKMDRVAEPKYISVMVN